MDHSNDIGYNSYNLYNLELDFKTYLNNLNKSASTIKNYLSDFRHFTGWLVSGENTNADINIVYLAQVIKLITNENIRNYRGYLLKTNLPENTVNRRLSTVRMLCTFCMSKGWISENPSSNVGNIPTEQPKLKMENASEQSAIEKEFQQYNLELNEGQEQTDSLFAPDIEDIKEFIQYITKNG